jgi:hypothetical protein
MIEDLGQMNNSRKRETMSGWLGQGYESLISKKKRDIYDNEILLKENT